MASNNSRCTVKIEIDPAGAAETFLSDDMRDAVAVKAQQLVTRKVNRIRNRGLVHTMTNNGLFSFRMKQGEKTWLAVIHPVDKAGYNIGITYGIKNL